MKGIESLTLSDFIDKEFIERLKLNFKDKKYYLLYPIKKDSFFMRKIIASNPKIKFVPLINFNKKEIINFLSKSKIYIDFGFHPFLTRPNY